MYYKVNPIFRLSGPQSEELREPADFHLLARHVDRDEIKEEPASTKGRQMAAAVQAKIAGQREVIDHFRAAFPKMSVDEVFRRLTRLNPEFFKD